MNREYMLATYVYQTLKRFDEDAYCNSETFYGRGRLTEGCLMADWLPTYCNGVYRIKWGTQYVTQCRYMNLMLFGCSYGLDVDIDKLENLEKIQNHLFSVLDKLNNGLETRVNFCCFCENYKVLPPTIIEALGEGCKLGWKMASITHPEISSFMPEEENKALAMSRLGDAESYVFPNGDEGFTIKFDNVMQFMNLLEII